MSPWQDILLGHSLSTFGLALVALAYTWLGKRPAFAHALWLLVLLKMLMPPLYRVECSAPAIPVLSAQESRRHSFSADRAQVPTTLDLDSSVLSFSPSNANRPMSKGETAPIPWRQVVLWVWGGGAIAVVWVIAFRVRRMRRCLRHAKEAPRFLKEDVRALCGDLGLTRVPDVRVIEATVAPFVWAFFSRARVIFPERLLRKLSEGQRRTLIVHELAHIKRRDHWVRSLEAIASVPFFWHPVLWWAKKFIRRAEEECCDAWVTSVLPRASRDYATALVATLDFLDSKPARISSLACGVDDLKSLTRRVTMIMKPESPRSLSTRTRALWITVSLVCLIVLPSFAQEEATLRKKASPPKEVNATLEETEPEPPLEATLSVEDPWTVKDFVVANSPSLSLTEFAVNDERMPVDRDFLQGAIFLCDQNGITIESLGVDGNGLKICGVLDSDVRFVPHAFKAQGLELIRFVEGDDRFVELFVPHRSPKNSVIAFGDLSEAYVRHVPAEETRREDPSKVNLKHLDAQSFGEDLQKFFRRNGSALKIHIVKEENSLIVWGNKDEVDAVVAMARANDRPSDPEQQRVRELEKKCAELEAEIESLKRKLKEVRRPKRRGAR